MNLDQLAPVPAPARSSFGVAQLDGRIFIAGGHTGVFHKYLPKNFTNKVNCYDIKTNSWSELRPLPRAMQGFRMIARPDSLYTFGGFICDDAVDADPWGARSVDDVFRYEFAKDKWEKIAELPRRRSSNALGSFGDKVHLVGGWDGTRTFLGDQDGSYYHVVVEVFDLKAGKCDLPRAKWQRTSPKRRAFTAVAVGKKLIMAGGLGEGGHMDMVSFVESYDMEANSWEMLAPLPDRMFSPGIGENQGTLFLAGGMGSSGVSSRQILTLKPGLGTWTPLSVELSKGRTFVEVVSLGGSSIGFLGGHNGYEDDQLPSPSFERLAL